MNHFIKLKITTSSSEEVEMLMAELMDHNYYAFEQKNNVLFAYIKQDDYDEAKLKEIIPVKDQFVKTVIADENWNKQWESNFQPVIINDFAAIRADFHEAVKQVKYNLVITPKMSFGTGHHATTFLMISQMGLLDFKNKSVLDFGTGTGVLAILAEKLGASFISAIDIDEWSIANTIENIEANNSERIVVEKRDTVDCNKQLDIVLANINLNVLTEAISSLWRVLNPGGVLLVSGFLKTDEEVMQNIFEKIGFLKVNSLSKDNWLSMQFKKPLK